MTEKEGVIIADPIKKLVINTGEVHVWIVATNTSSANYEEYLGWLSENELQRVPFYEFKEVKDAYVFSQGTLRKLLSRYLGISPNEIMLGRRKKGKPYSIDDPGLYFNLSNSGKLAAIAFSRDNEIGIDIEQIRNIPDLNDMIANNFTENEIKYIAARGADKKNRFFRAWTIKESYLKVIGEGMRLSPADIEFAINIESASLLTVGGIMEYEDLYFKNLELPVGYAGTLAYTNEKSKILQQEYKPYI